MSTSIRIRVATIAIVLLAAAARPVTAAITEISIPSGSQLASRPLIDNVWLVASQGGVLSTTVGIGLIVNPTWVNQNDSSDFSLHQNGPNGSPPYVQPHVPNVTASTVSYKFDKPTIVSGVEIVQHYNGVTEVKGLLGTTTLGPVFGPAGDVVSGPVAADGDSHVFNFANTSVAGTTFKLTVSKSSHESAFALHRLFLLDQAGNRIAPASGPTTTGPVGGSVSGLGGQKSVTCRNVTTGQVVTFTTASVAWNCEQRGLIVSSGNLIEQIARATK